MAGILSDVQQSKLLQMFDDLVARAEKPAPQLKDFQGNTEKYAAEKTAFDNNPLAKKIIAFRQEREQQVTQGASQADADKLYEARVAGLRAHYKKGLEEGAPDKDAEQKQQGMFDSLMGGNWMGAIKQFLMNIPVVGDMMAAGGVWLKSKLNGENLSFSQAKDRIKAKRALDGAAANIGADSMANQGIAVLENANFKPMERPPLQPVALPKPAADAARKEGEKAVIPPADAVTVTPGPKVPPPAASVPPPSSDSPPIRDH